MNQPSTNTIQQNTTTNVNNNMVEGQQMNNSVNQGTIADLGENGGAINNNNVEQQQQQEVQHNEDSDRLLLNWGYVFTFFSE